MASYNSWQGIKMHGNRSLLTDVLKDRFGFDGFVVGDWDGQEQVPGCTKFDCPAVILAGVDMVMGPDSWKALYRNTLDEARRGIIPAERIDDAVRRILRIKTLAGLFDRPSPERRAESGQFERLGSALHRALARQAVRESLVLLKNEHGLLPLDPHGTYLVAGEGADNLGQQAGGWTIDWQGDRNTAADFPGGTSIYAGLKAAITHAGGTAVLSKEGHYTRRPDAAIVVFGENPYAEFVGDREHLSFSQRGSFSRHGSFSQHVRGLDLLRRLRAAGVPTVTIFLSGRPLWVNPELNASDAFVAAWLPGTEGGGIADVVLRAPGSAVRDFTGRLSFSWPNTAMPVRFAGDQPVDALFPRGFGLTYRDGGSLPTLSENPHIPAAFADQGTLFFAGHVTAPWSIYVDDELAGGGVRLTDRQQASPDGAVTVTLQAPAVTANWRGGVSGTVRFSGPAIDLRTAAAAGGAVSFRYRVPHPPSATVALSIDCGRDCHTAIDITAPLAAVSGAWRRLAIPWRCLVPQGGSLAKVDTLAIMTAGSLTLSLTDLRLEPRAAPGTGCLRSG
jgi:beta-glucosidase